MKKQSIFFILPLLFSVNLTAVDYEAELKKITKAACTVKKAKKVFRSLKYSYSQMRKRKKLSKNAKLALESTLLPSCYLGYSNTKVRSAYLLGMVGLQKGVKASTLPYLTMIMSKHLVGKKAYVAYGKLWEQLTAVGLDSTEIKKIIRKGRNLGANIVAMRGIAYVYIELRKKDLDYHTSLKRALSLIKPIRRYTALHFLKKLNEKVRPKISSNIAYGTGYFSSQRGQFKASSNKSGYSLDASRLRSKLKAFLKAKYSFGAQSPKFIDDIGLVNALLFEKRTSAIALEQLKQIGEEVKDSNVKVGDLVFYGMADKPFFVGIILDANQVVIVTKKGLVIQSLDSDYLKAIQLQKRRINS